MSIYDLENRTYKFAYEIRTLVRKLPKTIANNEDAKQLIRSSGSVGANYIEANESLSKKDFKYRIKVCRKEAKESRYFLRLLYIIDTNIEKDKNNLVQEAFELTKIFGAILKK